MLVKKAEPKKSKYRLSDGGNLYLSISTTGGKSWVFLFKEQGRPKELGLGAYPAINLKAARTIAASLRAARASGKDLREQLRPIKGMTFGEAAIGAYNKRADSFRSAATHRQWKNDLFKRLEPWKNRPVNEIELRHVADVLRPILAKTPESGRRLRRRMEAAFSYAIALSEYNELNPARWKDGLENVLPIRSQPVKHHEALPYKHVPDFIELLRNREALSARCLEFTILTASRTTQARGAQWSEIDFKEKTWVLPSHRMKSGRAHFVPLSNDAVRLLKKLKARHDGKYLFPSFGREGHLSDAAMLNLLNRLGLRDGENKLTVHGFRSTMMEWMEYETLYSRDIGKHVLSHAVGSQAFRAYARGSAHEKRREVMEKWAEFCFQGTQ